MIMLFYWTNNYIYLCVSFQGYGEKSIGCQTTNSSGSHNHHDQIFSKHSPEFLHRHHSPQRRISSYCDVVALFHHAVATEREHKQQKHGAH